MKDLRKDSQSKFTVYVDASAQLIPQPIVVEAERVTSQKKRKTEAEEPLYLNRM
jgi:hypothetical protein